jgi:hypothetical protein
MEKLSVFIVFAFLIHFQLFSQVAINSDGTNPDNSAMLDVKSSSDGFLPPRVTRMQRDAIQNPVDGLMVFCTDCGHENSSSLSVFINGNWRLLWTICPVPDAPAEGIHVASGSQIIWNWNAVPGAIGYKWNTVNDYTTATDMLTSTTKTETELGPGPYTRYVWAYNACGRSDPTTLNKTLLFSIGQEYGGGVIFYIDGTGEHGLICAKTDQGVYQWGCGGYWDCITIGGTLWNIGAGQANTTRIVNGCGTPGIAARICDDLVLNEYSDWFLPSMNELSLMRQHRAIIGGFQEGQSYYSSTEFGCTAAFGYYMLSGTDPQTFSKYQGKYVRAARAF